MLMILLLHDSKHPVLFKILFHLSHLISLYIFSLSLSLSLFAIHFFSISLFLLLFAQEILFHSQKKNNKRQKRI